MPEGLACLRRNNNIQDIDALLIPCIGANKQHMRKVFHEQLGEDFPVEAFDRDAGKVFSGSREKRESL